MKTHPVPVSPPRSNRPGSPARARALGILTVLASLLLGDAARAAAPPGEREGDPFDLFLDRTRGDRADDEPRAAGFEVGATDGIVKGLLGILWRGVDGLLQRHGWV